MSRAGWVDVTCLVMAKAPLPGRCKTRLGAEAGMAEAARLAAAALRDTVRTCTEAFGAERCVLALAGDLHEVPEPQYLVAELAGWRVVGQRGAGFGARLANAHRDCGPGPVVQIGMDTPHARVADLLAAADLLVSPVERYAGGRYAGGRYAGRAVLGPAEDGGWWLLGLTDPRAAAVLTGVPMSTGRTGALTRAALEEHGLEVTTTVGLRDVDTVADAHHAATAAPESDFARAWALVAGVRS